MSSPASSDPFQVLGVSADASEGEIRARYLDLVKQFSPDREPDKFREVRAAYEAVKDPLSIAKRLIASPSEVAPPWRKVIEAQQHRPPRMTLAFVLSLGNRAVNAPATAPTFD